jgi:hypothetical protein
MMRNLKFGFFLFSCLFATFASAAQRTTEESFIPSYSAASLHYLWGSRADLEAVPGSSMAQHEVGVLGQYPVFRSEDSRFTAGVRYRWNHFDFNGPGLLGENRLDLYRVQVPLNYWHSFNDQWKLWAGVEPGLFSDFESITTDDFTASALLVAAYEWRPEWSLSFGGYYSRDLGNDRLLPVLGVIWRPNPHWNLSATFPRFRIAYAPDERMFFDFTIRPGGSGWNIRTRDGRDLDLEYKSWRISLGVERLMSERIGKLYAFGEIGTGLGQELTLNHDGNEVFSTDMDAILTLSTGLRLRF